MRAAVTRRKPKPKKPKKKGRPLTSDINAYRDVDMTLDPAAHNIQGLVDELTALIARPAIDPDMVVVSISGGVDKFKLKLTKPD